MSTAEATDPRPNGADGQRLVTGARTDETTEQRRVQWLAERKKYLTATDAAKVLGLSPYGDAVDVWLEKTGRDGAEFVETAEMRRGRRRESIVLDQYEETELVTLTRPLPYTLVASEKIPLLAFSPDALRGSLGSSLIPVDAKTARWADPTMWGEDGSDEFPIHYAIQLHVQMIVLGAEIAHLPTEFGGDEYRCYHLGSTPSRRDGLVELLGAWWQKHVVEDTQPAPTGSKSYADYLKRVYPRHDAGIAVDVRGDPALDALGPRFDSLRDAVKALEAERDEVGNQIRNAMGSAEVLQGSIWGATWKNNKDSEKLDAAGAVQDFQRLAAANGWLDEWRTVVRQRTTKQRGARTLRVTLKSGKA
jgi:putative phage-type endonuclease